jgi:hypothetical protein
MNARKKSRVESIVTWKRKQEVPKVLSLVKASIKALLHGDGQTIMQSIQEFVRTSFPQEIALQIFQQSLNDRSEHNLLLSQVLPYNLTMAFMASCSNETLTAEKIAMVTELQKRNKEITGAENNFLAFLLRYLPSSSTVDQYVVVQEDDQSSIEVIRAVTKNELFISALDADEPRDVLDFFFEQGVDIGQLAIDYCLKLKYQVFALGYSSKKYSSSFLLQRLEKLFDSIPSPIKHNIQERLCVYAKGLLACWQDPNWANQAHNVEIRVVEEEEYRTPKQISYNDIIQNKKFYTKALELIRGTD